MSTTNTPDQITSRPSGEPGTEQDKTVRECYWPNIRSHVFTPTDEPVLAVNCFACLEKITILDLHNNDPDAEEGVILICGHVVGKNCYKQWNSVQNRTENPICPICKRKLQCASCTRRCIEIPAPPSRSSSFTPFHTLSERTDGIDQISCRNCLLASTFLQRVVPAVETNDEYADLGLHKMNQALATWVFGTIESASSLIPVAEGATVDDDVLLDAVARQFAHELRGHWKAILEFREDEHADIENELDEEVMVFWG